MDDESINTLKMHLQKEYNFINVKKIVKIPPLGGLGGGMGRPMGGRGRTGNVLLILEGENGEIMQEVVPTNMITISSEKVTIPTPQRFYIINMKNLSKTVRNGLRSLALQTENPWEHLEKAYSNQPETKR